MTPGSFLTLSGAVVLVSFSIYDLWLEKVVVEVGRRRRLQDAIDFSSGPQVSMRFKKYGVPVPSAYSGAPEIVCDQPKEILDDLSAYCAWLTEGHAGLAATRAENRLAPGRSETARAPIDRVPPV